MYKIQTIHSYPSTLSVSGNWMHCSSELKREFPHLTETDLKLESGREIELLQRLESQLSKDRNEVLHLLKRWRVEII
jgi:hypothetical protein